MIFAQSDYDRFSLQAEEDFAQFKHCILKRTILPIVSGTAQYTLTDDIVSITQITYKGWRLEPISQRDLRNTLMSGTQQGRPFQYIYNNIGQLKIQLFPVPSETITGAITNLYAETDIRSQCIIEYWSTPDGVTNIIPLYIRRRLLKAGVMKELYSIQGKGQNIKAALYWTKMWNKLVDDYSLILDRLHNQPRNLNSSQDFRNGYKVPPPMLPIGRYGIGVDY